MWIMPVECVIACCQASGNQVPKSNGPSAHSTDSKELGRTLVSAQPIGAEVWKVIEAYVDHQAPRDDVTLVAIKLD